MDDNSRSSRDGKVIEASSFVLIALAVLLLIGLVMTLATAFSAGEGGDLASARMLTGVAVILALSGWFVWLSRELRRGSNRAQVAASATLLLVAIAWLVGSIALSVAEQEGDAGGYVLMGGVLFAFMCAPPGILLAGVARRTARRSS